MSAVEITITIDKGQLRGCSDQHLAMLWHVTQANPVPLDDRDAGEIAEYVGREIIRRWLTTTQPELWRHQGQHYYWNELRQLGKWKDGEFVPDAATVDASNDRAEASA